MRTKLQEKRLLKLCDFLDKLPRSKFDFVREVTKTDEKHTCGTVCCAIGWAPAVFPRLIKWNPNKLNGSDDWIGWYLDKTGEIESWSNAITRLFGVPYELFLPNHQTSEEQKLDNCGYHATPKQVSKMLRRYLKLNPITK